MSINSRGASGRLLIALFSSTAMSICWTQASADENLPAVSEFNFKFDANGGNYDGTPLYFGTAAAAVPLGHRYGLQVDGLIGTLEGDGFGGAAAHLFWRDPSIGLVGIYGSGFTNTARVNYQMANIGIEGALYLGQFSVEATVGGQFVSDQDADVFGAATAAFYPIDDLRLYGGYRYCFGESAAAAGFEWQFPYQLDDSINWAIFADSRFREDETVAWGGVRLYFGSQKPLIRRHREDDPGPLLPDDLNFINKVLPPAPPAPPPQDGVDCNPQIDECPILDGVGITPSPT